MDVACKNPSRLSRIPDAYRADKDKTQTLLSVLSRVDNRRLEEWLNSKGAKEQENSPKSLIVGERSYNNTINSNKPMNGFTLNFIMCGAPEGERNLSLFKAACDLFKCGYSEDEIIDKLERPSGLDNQEVVRTIKSAIRKVESDQD